MISINVNLIITINKKIPELDAEEKVQLRGALDPKAAKSKKIRYPVLGIKTDEKDKISFLVKNQKNKLVAVAADDCEIV